MNVAETARRAIELHRAGRHAEAETLYRQILLQQPNEVNALHGLGFLAFQAENLGAAEQLLRRAAELAGNPVAQAAIRNNLANALQAMGRLDEAMREYRCSIQLNPAPPDAYSNLGHVLHVLNRDDEALELYRQALARNPNHAAVHNNIAEALRAMGRLEEAVGYYEKSLALSPAHAAIVHNNFGEARLAQGRLDEAVAHYRRAIQLRPDHAENHSNLLHSLHYLPQSDSASIAAEHAKWAADVEARAGAVAPHSNIRDPDRRLRVGYVSGDFQTHAIDYFLDPILAHHDHERLEIFCYSNTQRADATTARLRGYSDHWREIFGTPDDAAAELIRRDAIDILIDLSVHSGRNRLAVFARKPAPVQITYLGYPGTSGLSRMDYRITDPRLEAPGVIEGPERPLLLPETYFCYRPPDVAPPVGALPADSRGYITFGSPNRLAKINDAVIATWSTLLARVPDSKLVLMSVGLVDRATREQLAARFARHGVTADRLHLKPPQRLADYLAEIERMDIALDTFPFNGGTTTLHTLWMGVPVITLAGNRAVSRMGLSILSNIGLRDLAAQSAEDYIRLGVQLANDLARLRELRNEMRARLKNSPLTNATRFTRHLESVYREAWRSWSGVNTPTEPRGTTAE